MKLLSCKPEIRTEKSFAGLLDCAFQHKIQSATAQINYKGPAIDAQTWKQVLAFFQWTYDTTHSESQVRLFVNLRDSRWAAWAFPQEARSGMTAKELDTPDMKTQRAQFADSEGWLYFGTVHHHCSMQAFQSGTDTNNEEGIDGLHITIGKMDAASYDMHARFYLGGFKFEPDMSKFWDIGQNLRDLLPMDLWDRVARFQMCAKADPSTEFPAQWKQNLIEVKQTFPYQNDYPWSYPQSRQAAGTTSPTHAGESFGRPRWIRARHLIGALAVSALDLPEQSAAQEKLCEWLESLYMGSPEIPEELTKLFELMDEYNISLKDILEEIPADNDLSACIKMFKSNQADPVSTNHSLALADKAKADAEKEDPQIAAWRQQAGMMD